MKVDLNDLMLFCYIIREGSLTKSALYLNVSLATISRRMKVLEARLNRKLFFRNNRGVKLTPFGSRLYEQCSGDIFRLDERIKELFFSDLDMKGAITISSPRALYFHLLSDKIARFQKQYPDINIEVNLSLNQSDNNRQKDILICSDIVNFTSCLKRKVSTIDLVLCITPEYKTRLLTLINPEDIYKYRVIKVSPYDTWTFQRVVENNIIDEISINPEPYFSANEFELAKKMTLDGIGLCLLPYPIVKDEISCGQLIRCLPEWEHISISHYIICTHHGKIPRRIQRLINFVSEDIEQ